MVDDQKPRVTAWNLRPFPEDIKRECNARAGKEGKADWKWLADYLRKVLPIIETSETTDTPEESRQTDNLRTQAEPNRRRATESGEANRTKKRSP
jgi:hypothetical protein